MAVGTQVLAFEAEAAALEAIALASLRSLRAAASLLNIRWLSILARHIKSRSELEVLPQLRARLQFWD